MFHGRLKSRSVGWVVLWLAISFVPALKAQAQTTLTVGVPDFIKGVAEETVVKPFEAENPDIDIQLVSVNQTPSYSGSDDVKTYLDSIAEYVGVSDVLLFTESSLIPEVTRAGYLVDLMPFVRSDPEMSADDFYPQFWNAFQWDGGMWSFPIAGDAVAMIYDPAKFDEASLAYPDAFWTMKDFENAVRVLSEVDTTTGKVKKSGVQVFDGRSPIILSLFGKALYDPTNPDALPILKDADLQTVMQEWYDLDKEGLFTQPAGEFSSDQPMLVAQTLFANLPGQTTDRKIAPLPGSRSPLVINGMSISVGSQHPDEAYRFIKYVSNSANAATAFLSALPARKSLVGVEVDKTNNPIAALIPAPDADTIAIIEGLVESGYAPNETLYATHIGLALAQMTAQDYDTKTALEEQEANLVASRATAAERIGTVTVSVTAPDASAPVAAEGKISLKFGVVGFFGGLPNQKDWDTAVQDFIDSDSQVGAIKVEQAGGILSGGTEDIVKNYDCFYQNGNIVPSADLTLFAPLDSYVASDSTYNADDVVEGAINQLKREGQLWALPMSISPAAMWYNPDKIAEANAFTPSEGWTIGDFETVVRALKDVMTTDTPAFVPRDPADGSYMLALVAAYGGLPIDFSQQPIKIDFANPAVIEASRQALNLARDGYIKYSPLGNLGQGGVFFGDDTTVYGVYSQTLGGFFNRGGGPLGQNADATNTNPTTYDLVSFPQGSDYVPVPYNVTAGYISAQSANPDACYRFMRSLMERPSLFGGMPILRSLLDSDQVIGSLGRSAVDFYRGLDAAMSNPKAVTLGGFTGTSGGGDLLAVIWLYKAWDKYVADDSIDLEKEMQDADLYAKGYLECLAQAQADGTIKAGLGLLDSFRQWRTCAVKVDPTLDSALPNF